MRGSLSVYPLYTLEWSRSYLLAGQHLSCPTTDTAARRLSFRNMRNVGSAGPGGLLHLIYVDRTCTEDAPSFQLITHPRTPLSNLLYQRLHHAACFELGYTQPRSQPTDQIPGQPKAKL